MSFIKTRQSWLTAPVIWLCGFIILLIIGANNTPEWIKLNFNMKGHSPVETATVALFFFLILFIWLLPPVSLKTVKGKLLCFNFSVITFIAICREMDWHKAMIHVSNIEGATHGTPFKMRFLTNSINPLSDRLLVLFWFIVVIALCAGTLLWYIRPLLKGLFRFHPVCWSIAFVGGTGILIHIFDRMGSVLRNDYGILLTDNQKAMACVLEEGQELLLPLFIIVAIIQSHFIYNRDTDDEISQFKEL
jgi:hypothetical protein